MFWPLGAAQSGEWTGRGLLRGSDLKAEPGAEAQALGDSETSCGSSAVQSQGKGTET